MYPDESGEIRQPPQPQELELDGPGGLKFRVRGYDFLTLVILGIATGLGWLLWDLRANAQREHAEITKTQVVVETSVAEMAYILTLSQAEREKLNLSMPESLRKKARDRNY